MMFCLRCIGRLVLLPRWMGRKGPENEIQLGVNLEALVMTWKWKKKVVIVHCLRGKWIDFLPRL